MNINCPLSWIRMMRVLIFSGIFFNAAVQAEQELETLAAFTGDNGSEPGALVQGKDGTFYGTTSSGGKSNLGTIFKMVPSKPMETLVAFTGENGAQPSPRLVMGRDGSLYGTTKKGGVSDLGTVYKISPDGNFQTIASFDAKTGRDPQSDLAVDDDGTIYGCTGLGGANDKGTLFTIGSDHVIKTMISFSDKTGAYPEGLCKASDGKFYGATCSGGACDTGTVFTINSHGDFSAICSFCMLDATSDHKHLSESSEGTFYGTSFNGGDSNLGAVYSITHDGVVNHIRSFTGEAGAHPGPDLVEWHNGYFYMQHLADSMRIKPNREQWMGLNFCGTTTSGGEHGNGTIFRITADGRLATMVSFTGVEGKNPGASPNSLVPAADGNLYGTTSSGGPRNKGTVFCLKMPSLSLAADAYKPLPSVGMPMLNLLPIVSH